MQNVLLILFLILFSVSTLLTYLAVRRGWTRTLVSALIGFVADVLFIMWASMARGSLFLTALITGIVLSLMFTLMTVSIAMFYRANPSRQPGQPSVPPQP
jgi:hypothetical protein